MKTKEEILDNTHSFLDNTLVRCYEEVEILDAIDEYARQQSIEFAEWKEKCAYVLYAGLYSNEWALTYKKPKTFTHSDLYELFLKSKNK